MLSKPRPVCDILLQFLGGRRPAPKSTPAAHSVASGEQRPRLCPCCPLELPLASSQPPLRTPFPASSFLSGAGSSASSSLLLLSGLLSHSLPRGLGAASLCRLPPLSVSPASLDFKDTTLSLPPRPSLPPCVLVGSSPLGLVLILLSQEETHGILRWGNSRRVQQSPDLQGPGQK